jgi:hypothetical protein
MNIKNKNAHGNKIKNPKNENRNPNKLLAIKTSNSSKKLPILYEDRIKYLKS